MYYAVVSNGELLFLTQGRCAAVKKMSENPGSDLATVATLEELDVLLNTPAPTPEEQASEAMKNLMSKLDDWGLNQDFVDELKESGEKLMAEVKSLGNKGMKVVGDGFIAMGELLRQAQEEDKNVCQQPEKPKCCGGQHCHE